MDDIEKSVERLVASMNEALERVRLAAALDVADDLFRLLNTVYDSGIGPLIAAAHVGALTDERIEDVRVMLLHWQSARGDVETLLRTLREPPAGAVEGTLREPPPSAS